MIFKEVLLVMAWSCAVRWVGGGAKGVECAANRLFLLIIFRVASGQQKTPRLPVRGFANLASFFLLTRRFVPHLVAR